MLSLSLTLFSGFGGGGGDPGEVLFSETLVALTGALNNFTLVVRIRMDDVSSPAAPDITVTGVKVTVQGSIDKVYIGVAAGVGDDWDAASLTQVLFGGSPGVTQGVEDQTQSDLTSLTWNMTDPLLISMYTGVSHSGSRHTAFTNYADLFHLSGSDVASSADKTGLSTIGNDLYVVSSIALFGDAVPPEGSIEAETLLLTGVYGWA